MPSNVPRPHPHHSAVRAGALPAPAALLLALVATPAVAQEATAPRDRLSVSPVVAPPPPARATSLVLGGFAVAKSRLALAKLEHARDQWALIADVTRDGVKERWSARTARPASRGDYVMWAASAAVRRYSRPGARGLYAEAGGGVGRAALEVTSDGGEGATRRAVVPLAALGAGARFGIGRTPAFVELGLRTSVPLATRHLYTDAAPPAGSTRDPVTYQSWYLGRGKASSQLFIGLGATR